MKIIVFEKSNLFMQKTKITSFFKNLKIKEPQNRTSSYSSDIFNAAGRVILILWEVDLKKNIVASKDII